MLDTVQISASKVGSYTPRELRASLKKDGLTAGYTCNSEKSEDPEEIAVFSARYVKRNVWSFRWWTFSEI